MMNKKVFRNRVISVQGMYIKYDENGEIGLAGDILNANFFYDKEYCEKVANSLIEKFPHTEIEVQKLYMEIEVQETTIIT